MPSSCLPSQSISKDEFQLIPLIIQQIKPNVHSELYTLFVNALFNLSANQPLIEEIDNRILYEIVGLASEMMKN